MGIVVFVFRQGHGAEAIWHVHAIDSVIPWIPSMIFAFLYGPPRWTTRSSRSPHMREAYDQTGSTDRAIELGLARTGKLVTSAALVLMPAFSVLSTGSRIDPKQFAIALAAGIVFDATAIRALLVPSLMGLLDDWNWRCPRRRARSARQAASCKGRGGGGAMRPIVKTGTARTFAPERVIALSS